MNVVEFVLARTAEEESQAQRALSGPKDDGRWEVMCHWNEYDGQTREEHEAGWAHDSECGIEGHGIRIYDEGGHDRDQALYIAAHDPARTLAEVAAHREIVRVVQGLGGHYEPDAARTAPWIIRYLATIWSDHPDYDPKWRP